MTIRLSSKGGSSSFFATFASGALQINLGASGDILVLTPPTGKRVRLTGLQAQTAETGITITIGSKTVVSSLTLEASDTPVGSFLISTSTNASYGSSDKGFIPYLEGNVDEVITIKKDTGSTASNIRYSYQFGE